MYFQNYWNQLFQKNAGTEQVKAVAMRLQNHLETLREELQLVLPEQNKNLGKGYQFEVDHIIMEMVQGLKIPGM